MSHVHGDPSLECTWGACPFTDQRFVPPVSEACKGGMHPACSLCGCDTCHHRCERCGELCRTVYDGSDGKLVCATCKKNDIAADIPARTSIGPLPEWEARRRPVTDI